jgi:hypothetical protein
MRWTKSNWAVLTEILRYALLFVRRGVFRRVFFVSWPMLVTMLYALNLIVLATVLSIAAGAIAGAFWGLPLGIATTVAAFAGLVSLREPLEDRITAFWLARILSFIADQGEDKIPQLDDRLDRFSERIAEVLHHGAADEVLIAGHSVGTQLAVSVAARVARRVPDARFSLLTLGHTIPLQSFQPGAAKFRAELAEVAGNHRIDWIDVSAAIDSACFPLTDPVTVSGLSHADPLQPRPKLVSARFPKLFTAETYAKLRRQFQRAHFQYLMATELAGDYDYFLITAGQRRLADRFSHLDSVRDFNRFRLGRS